MSDYADDYQMSELMIVAGSRQLRNDDVAIIGTGLPFLASQLAKESHAPDMTLVVEGGQYDARPSHVPYTVGDASLTNGAGMTNMFVMASTLLNNELDVGFIGGAQVDKYGNLNSTVIGDYEDPAVRLPGSGGASPIAAHCDRTVIIMPQERRRFVEEVDFLTSPGYLDGPGAREEAGLPGDGPVALVSDMGVYSFDDETREMVLESHHPGVSVDEVREAVMWDLKVSDDVTETEKPTEDEVEFLRELDKEGMFLNRQEFLAELNEVGDNFIQGDY
jgi:glutaconate CoA-transferase subunit B